jgi:hypothetical protein
VNTASPYLPPIHFIGHSLGTLVNAAAANSLGSGFDRGNVQMTLFDEASLATFTDCSKFLWLATQGSPSNRRNYLPSLPNQFLWADNYVSLVGNLSPRAANMICEYGMPKFARDFRDLISQAADFHGYPCSWYEQTIYHSLSDSFQMGNRWSFERNGFPQAPAPGTVYLQTDSEWELTKMKNYSDGEALLNQRFEIYHHSYETAFMGQSFAGFNNGSVVGGIITFEAASAVDLLLHLNTTINNFFGSDTVRPRGGNIGVPAYAWIPVTIPTNAAFMSFDFLVTGDVNADSFAVALDGTNLLAVQLRLVQTNVLLNTGSLDVAESAGKQVELFAGIVGGSSTNVSVTVSNLQFYIPQAPALKAKVDAGNLLLTWPLAPEFTLHSTTNLADPNSWMPLDNPGAVVDFQNIVTNAISEPIRFYRLKK